MHIFKIRGEKRPDFRINKSFYAFIYAQFYIGGVDYKDRSSDLNPSESVE